jgi:PiT family inorganic phosphate transporter
VEIPLAIIVAAIGVSFYTCFMGGANDFANSFGTSIGSGAITLKQAVLIATASNIVGATLAGGHVTDTIRKGIISPESFAGDPRALLYGLLAALCGAGLFLQLATRFGLPVSTTHATVGGVVGFGVLYAGLDSVSWGKMTQVVLSWFTSPVAGGIIGYTTFRIIQSKVLNARDPIEASKRVLPWFVGIVTSIIILSLLYKGLKNVHFLRALHGLPFWAVFLASLPPAVAAAFMVRRRLLRPVSGGNPDPLAAVEGRFRYLQILTAAYVSFAHGANDVANGVGPLAGIWAIFRTGTVTQKAPVPMWILFMGGVGIVLGLAVFGRRVIETIGKKITHITPSRGFAAEFAAATTVLILTKKGMPVSTTHTLVGSVIGVGFARGIAALDLRVVRNIFASWIVTLPATIVLSMIFFFAFQHLLP